MLNPNIKQVPISSPLKGVNTVVNREGQPPDTCWNSVNMLPFDRYGRKRVAQRPGLTNPFTSFDTGNFVQNLLTVNNIVYASQAFATPGFTLPPGQTGVPIFQVPIITPGLATQTYTLSNPTPTSGPNANQSQPLVFGVSAPITFTSHSFSPATGYTNDLFRIRINCPSLIGGFCTFALTLISTNSAFQTGQLESAETFTGSSVALTSSFFLSNLTGGTSTITGKVLFLLNSPPGTARTAFEIDSYTSTFGGTGPTLGVYDGGLQTTTNVAKGPGTVDFISGSAGTNFTSAAVG